MLLYAIFRSSIHRIELPRIADDSPYLVTIRKVTGYLLNILTVLLIFAVWVQKLGDLTVAVGLLAAGLAFALQEIIGSIAGWTTIISGQPFVIGDRIETGGIRGDVVDVSLLRTKLMEIVTGWEATMIPAASSRYRTPISSKNHFITTHAI